MASRILSFKRRFQGLRCPKPRFSHCKPGLSITVKPQKLSSSAPATQKPIDLIEKIVSRVAFRGSQTQPWKGNGW
jgi:hypothetical protein